MFVGTEKYMAPEMISGKPYDGCKVDIYACGVILFAMLTSLSPVCARAAMDDYLYRYIL